MWKLPFVAGWDCHTRPQPADNYAMHECTGGSFIFANQSRAGAALPPTFVVVAVLPPCTILIRTDPINWMA